MPSKKFESLNMKTVEEARDLMGDRFPMMVKYFIEDTDMYFKEIKRAVSEKNAEIAISPSHTVKSSARQIGAEKVSTAARLIEETCRDIAEGGSSTMEDLTTLVNDLEQAINSAKPDLEKL